MKKDIDMIMEDYISAIDDEKLLSDIRKEIEEFLEGKRKTFTVKLPEPEGTDFQKAVWDQLKKIPFGEAMTYGQIAEAIGRPRAARAVGSACGANPYSVIVPCHRALAVNGLGGFGLGLDMKKRLLALEGR